MEYKYASLYELKPCSEDYYLMDYSKHVSGYKLKTIRTRELDVAGFEYDKKVRTIKDYLMNCYKAIPKEIVIQPLKPNSRTMTDRYDETMKVRVRCTWLKRQDLIHEDIDCCFPIGKLLKTINAEINGLTSESLKKEKKQDQLVLDFLNNGENHETTHV